MPNPLSEEDPDWSDELLLTTAADFPGVGSDADLGDIDRFRAGVSRLVGKTIGQRSPGSEDRGVSVFLLQPGGLPAAVEDRCCRVPMLDRARETLDRRVWFVTHVVTVGRWVSAPYDDDDELFRFVTDEIGLGRVPAIVFDPRDPGPELRYYANGLGDPESIDSLQIANSPISLEEIFRRIELIYRNQLVTPGAQPRAAKLWSDARRGLTASNAEDVLSALLATGLQTAFPTCRARVEQPQPTGRLDIELEERIPDQPGAIMRHAILELKVLRGRNPNGSAVSVRRVRQWIEDGVGQAAAYRDDKGALAGALCCFDMRENYTGEQCFAHVLDSAADMEVELRVWHLFPSAQAYRRHLVASGALSRRGAPVREPLP